MRIVKLLVAFVLLAYVGMCFAAKFDGGATSGAPSRSAEDARKAGMLVKPVHVVVDSGGPRGVTDAWIEIGAYNCYLLGAFRRRCPVRTFSAETHDTLYLLSIAVPPGVALGEFRPGASNRRSRWNGTAGTIEGYSIAPPLPDTIHLRAAPVPREGYPVILQDGRNAWDAAPKEP